MDDFSLEAHFGHLEMNNLGEDVKIEFVSAEEMAAEQRMYEEQRMREAAQKEKQAAEKRILEEQQRWREAVEREMKAIEQRMQEEQRKREAAEAENKRMLEEQRRREAEEIERKAVNRRIRKEQRKREAAEAENKRLLESRLVTSGIMGGGGGYPYDMNVKADKIPRITKLIIRSSVSIYYIGAQYMYPDGSMGSFGMGGSEGNYNEIPLATDEYITRIKGSTSYGFGDYSLKVIKSLSIATNKEDYGTYGWAFYSFDFEISCGTDRKIVGLYGRAGATYVHALGAYMFPR